MLGASRISIITSPGSGEWTTNGRSDSKKVTRTFVDGFESDLQEKEILIIFIYKVKS